MQHPDFKGHKVFCDCNASWIRDVISSKRHYDIDYRFTDSVCPDCRLIPWYYIYIKTAATSSLISLNETVEANAKSLGAKEPVGATWPQAKLAGKPMSPFLASLTLAQRRQLYANLIAFKTFASKAFGGVAVRCSVITMPKRGGVGFRVYRNGVPTELPRTIYTYLSDIQCYPFLAHSTTEGSIDWC
jgi:hypothetical protein